MVSRAGSTTSSTRSSANKPAEMLYVISDRRPCGFKRFLLAPPARMVRSAVRPSSVPLTISVRSSWPTTIVSISYRSSSQSLSVPLPAPCVSANAETGPPDGDQLRSSDGPLLNTHRSTKQNHAQLASAGGALIWPCVRCESSPEDVCREMGSGSESGEASEQRPRRSGAQRGQAHDSYWPRWLVL